jgi:hypothetical protein
MSIEVLAVALTILAFATSPILTKAFNTGVRIPSFLYFHTPLLVVALCYGPNRFISILVFSLFLLGHTLIAAFYVWYRDM